MEEQEEQDHEQCADDKPRDRRTDHWDHDFGQKARFPFENGPVAVRIGQCRAAKTTNKGMA